jgi:hypothetical protein
MAPPDGIIHDACGPLVVTLEAGTSEAQRSGISAALAAWNSLGFTRLSLEGEGEAVALRFEAAAAFFHGFYDPDTGEVLINRDLTDPQELEVVVAHELGHAMGLPHVAPKERSSVMNSGNVTLRPTPDDSAQIEARCR